MAGRSEQAVPPPATPRFPLGEPADATGGGLRGLVQQKERELHDINEYRIHALEGLVADREREARSAPFRRAALR